MIEFTAQHFEELCTSDPVRTQLGSLESNRKSALRKFWTRLIGGAVLAIAIAVSLFSSGWDTVAWILGVVVFVFAIISAIVPITKAGEDLKHPVLETLAGKGGLDYLPDGFDPPVYPEARSALFGNWLSRETFSDLFHGKDPEDRNFAVYEALLQRKQGKSTTTVFRGQAYAFQRRSKRDGVTVVVPDRGLFNFFKPQRGMERVKIESDPEFEKKFEVYSTAPLEAKQLLFSSDLRRRLLELSQAGRVFVYIGPEDALVAAAGKDRFEAGSMFRARSGEERARSMFDDVCAAMATLRGLRADLG